MELSRGNGTFRSKLEKLKKSTPKEILYISDSKIKKILIFSR